MIGIYCITNMVNGKKYIGQSRDIKYRWSRHCARYRKTHLTESIGKYGVDSFKFEVIREVGDSGITSILLDCLEQLYIKKYNTMDPLFGYNKISGGSSGRIPSQETVEKISRNRKGKNCRPHTEEEKRKISIAHTGKKRPPFSPEWIEKMRIAATGRKHSEETKRRMSESAKRHRL